jgi:thiol-disulfide isomerase/thioredoxin
MTRAATVLLLISGTIGIPLNGGSLSIEGYRVGVDDMALDGNAWVIKYYTSWCGHCKKMAPAWALFETALDGENINVGEIDCGKEPGFCAKIAGYPSIIYHASGQNTTFESLGSPDVWDLLTFVQSRSGMPVAAGAPWLSYIKTEGLQFYLSSVKQVLQLAKAVLLFALGGEDSYETTQIDMAVVVIAVCIIVVAWLVCVVLFLAIIMIVYGDGKDSDPQYQPKMEPDPLEAAISDIEHRVKQSELDSLQGKDKPPAEDDLQKKKEE